MVASPPNGAAPGLATVRGLCQRSWSMQHLIRPVISLLVLVTAASCSNDDAENTVSGDCRVRESRYEILYSPPLEADTLACPFDDFPVRDAGGLASCDWRERTSIAAGDCSLLPGRTLISRDDEGTTCSVEQRATADGGTPSEPGWYFVADGEPGDCLPHFVHVPGSEPVEGTLITIDCLLEQTGTCD